MRLTPNGRLEKRFRSMTHLGSGGEEIPPGSRFLSLPKDLVLVIELHRPGDMMRREFTGLVGGAASPNGIAVVKSAVDPTLQLRHRQTPKTSDH
jgi:hypothetical protein